MSERFTPDKAKFKDERGAYITQSLFLEFNYDTEKAVYTWTDADKEYKGKVYPSLRRLYLEMRDPTEYLFAEKYLWGWNHWQRITANKALAEHVNEWREELEIKLRAEAVRAMVGKALVGDGFSPTRWVADGEWRSKKPGRPTNAQRESERQTRERVLQAAQGDAARIAHLIPKK